MNKILLIFLIFIGAFSIYGILTLQPDFIAIFALIIMGVLISIAADLIEQFFPKSRLGKFVRTIESWLSDARF